MAIVISGVNNNDKITASDGTIDLLSGVNYAGIITAPGFTASNNITAASINVGSNIQIGNAGIITATTLIGDVTGNVTGNVNATSNLLLQIGGSEKFRVGSSGQLGIGGANYGTSGQVLTSGGSGSAATWSTVSGTTINNNADNRVITGSGSANTLNGEANLTFDGNNLNQTIDNSGEGIRITAPNNHYSVLRFDSNATAANGSLCNIQGHWNGNEVANIIFAAGSDTTNKDDGYIRMFTRESGQSNTERVQIQKAGGLISSKGGSIPFSDGYSAIEARAPEGTTQLTVTNTTYESGTFDNETGIWFKGNYSGNDERAKSAIIHKNTGDYGVGDLYICLDGNADNTNATVNDVKMLITKDGNVTKPGNAAFHVTGTASGVSVNANTAVTLPYNTETGSSGYFDVGAHFDTGNYRFTAPVAGIYFFYASMLNFPSSNSSYFTLVGAKNGSRSYSYGFARVNSENSQADINFSTIVSLQANDTFEIQMETANGSNYNYYISGGHGHFFGFLLQ